MLADHAPKAGQKQNRHHQKYRHLQTHAAAEESHHNGHQRTGGEPDGHQRDSGRFCQDENHHSRQPENSFPIHCDTSFSRIVI